MSTPESTSDSPLDDTLSVLGRHRRRRLLATLDDRDTVSVSELAREFVAAERDKSPTAVTTEERRRTEIRLHHADLPKLSAAGLVQYDPGCGVVSIDDLPLTGSEWLETPVDEALSAWDG